MKYFLLETPASGVGLGAVLSQIQIDGTIRPIAFANRTLQPHERNYGSSEMEALAVVWAVKHFRHYIYGHHCTVFTDHEALKTLLNTPQPSGKLARRGVVLLELEFRIEYRPVKTNARADALFCHPVTLLKDDVSQMQAHPLITAMVDKPPAATVAREGSNKDSLSYRQRHDPQLVDIIQYIETGELPKEEKRTQEVALTSTAFTMLNNVLYRIEIDSTLRIVPPTSDRHKLFLETHRGIF